MKRPLRPAVAAHVQKALANSTGRAAPERELQIAAAGLLRAILPPSVTFWHTPNGEVRAKATAGILKAMGVRPGIHDLLFLMPDGRLFAIELKPPPKRNALTAGQVDFGASLKACGCEWAVACTVAEVQTIVVAWLAMYQLKPRGRLC